MNRLLYTLLFYLAMPVVFMRLLWQSRTAPDYRRRWRERLGYYNATGLRAPDTCLVFHAVSVGELHAAQPLIKACLSEIPDCKLLVTTTSVTGSKRVAELFGDQVLHCYLPYDLPGALNRFFRFFNPSLLVVMETELWPNLLHHAHHHGVKTLVVNARLSDKSLRKYQKVRSLSRRMLACVDLVAAQFEHDAEHFRQLGLRDSALTVSGTVKFDLTVNQAQRDAGLALKAQLARPVLVAGSTREGEDEKVLAAFRQVLAAVPDMLLVLVPRHPERFGAAAALLESEGFTYRRYSRERCPGPLVQVLLGDSMGEMTFYYSLGDLAFVGGSLVNTGCQNIIEPAALGLPVLTGPSLYNFRTVSNLLKEGGGMRVVADADELAETIISLMKDKGEMAEMSRRVLAVVERNRGATRRLLNLIQERLPA